MTTLKRVRPIEPLEWVVVANAARARLFERDAENQAMRELASFMPVSYTHLTLPPSDLV